MDSSQALSIVQALADGVDPRSGEIFAADSPYQDAQTVRALVVAIQGLQRQIASEQRRRSLPEKVGQAWSSEDETFLASEFDSGKNLSELARQLHRTTGAVRARLVKLGKIEEESPFQPYRRSHHQ